MDLRRTIAAAALATSLAFVFADQVPDPGFRRGHRGWVSAHTLAIAQKASAGNGFVGYTISLATPDSRELYYFDRYPVFFSALLHAAQTAVPMGKAAQIQVARQVMNVVYALTVLAAVLLLVELGLSLEGAVAAAALAAAGAMVVEYRDMVHYDQPALLGSVVLLWAIAAWPRIGHQRGVYAATAVAVCLGRGYASFAVLGLWWLFEAVRTLRARPQADTGRISAAVREILFGVPARACVLAIVLAGACVAYNVRAESRARDVAWTQTSIIQSATRRLSLDPQFNEKTGRRRTWSHFLDVEQQNLARSVVPWSRRDPLHDHKNTGKAVAAVTAALALGFAISRKPEMRIPWLLMCLSGPLWLVLMRNLAAFHPYTAVFLFPVALTAFAAVLAVVDRRRQWAAALAACTLLVACTAARNDVLGRDSADLLQQTRDMERVEKTLGRRDAVAADPRLFRGVPFALGFYLPRQDILVEGPASLVLTGEASFRGRNLTPDNHRIFLFRADPPSRAHSSLARLQPGSSAARTGAPRTSHGQRHRNVR